MSTPASDTLTRAADRLEDLAWHFQSYVDNWQDTPGCFDSPVDVWRYDNVERFSFGGDWIRAMSPAVAAPLANILRGVAFTLSCHPEYTDQNRNYLDFARLILEESE